MTAETPADSRDHLKNSRPVSFDRVAKTASGKAAVAHLVALLDAKAVRRRARKANDRQRLEATLEALVMDLYVVAKARPGRFLAYSRGGASYLKRSRYANPEVTLTAVVEVADFLMAAGLADGRPGSYHRVNHDFGTTGRGYLSRLRATAALLSLLEDQFGLRPEAVGFRSGAEVLRLKGAPERRKGPKPLMDYDDTPETNAMRETLRRVNAALASVEIGLDVASETLGLTETYSGPQDEPEDTQETDPEDRLDALDRSRTALYRVFNNGSWEQGGRFYGGWWIAEKKERRPFITIDGAPTVELDYRSLHPRLCYHLSGIPYAAESDPYAVPGLTESGLRGIVKIGFNQLLNADTETKIKAPTEAKSLLAKRMKWADVLAMIQDHHEPILHWFRSGRGLELQYVESCIAERVVSYFAFRGLPVLPIHDGFIVSADHECKLGETMMLAYAGALSRFSTVRAYPVIGGWSSEEMETETMKTLFRL